MWRFHLETLFHGGGITFTGVVCRAWEVCREAYPARALFPRTVSDAVCRDIEVAGLQGAGRAGQTRGGTAQGVEGDEAEERRGGCRLSAGVAGSTYG